jgi:transposase
MDGELIKRRFLALAPFLDERLRRLYAAAEATVIGYGGISRVSRETGISRRAIVQGYKELKHPPPKLSQRVRKQGGGRKRAVAKDPRLLQDLESLVEPATCGDPQSPLRWTSKSVRKLSDELKRMGHSCNHTLVAELLHELGYSLQAKGAGTGRPSGL